MTLAPGLCLGTHCSRGSASLRNAIETLMFGDSAGRACNAVDSKAEPWNQWLRWPRSVNSKGSFKRTLQMNRSQALRLLSECTGDDIWSIEYCRKSHVPEAWIEELQDAYESGFDATNQTIYYRNVVVNQFEGIRDVDLACKLGQLLKVNVSRIVQQQTSRSNVVREIREAIEEGD